MNTFNNTTGLPATGPKPVRYVSRDGTVDFLATNEERPQLCGSRVRVGGRVYSVTSVIHYEDEIKVWMRAEVVDVMGA